MEMLGRLGPTGWRHAAARQPRSPDMGLAQNLGHAAEQGAAVARLGGGPGRNFSLGAPRPAGLGPEGRAMAPLSAQPPQPADMLRSLLGGRSPRGVPGPTSGRTGGGGVTASRSGQEMAVRQQVYDGLVAGNTPKEIASRFAFTRDWKTIQDFLHR